MSHLVFPAYNINGTKRQIRPISPHFQKLQKGKETAKAFFNLHTRAAMCKTRATPFAAAVAGFLISVYFTPKSYPEKAMSFILTHFFFVIRI